MEMSPRAKALLATALLLALPAPRAASSTPGSGEEATRLENGDFLVASDVPSDQAGALKADLAFLRTLNLPQDPELQRLLGIDSGLSPAVLEKWAAERVHYIVSEEMEIRPRILLWDYPFENSLAGLWAETGARSLLSQITAAPAPRAGTVMANTGTEIYLRSKQRHALAGLEIPGVGMVRVTSPRTGILQIGSGLFRPVLEKRGVSDSASPAYSIYHLMALFHEARHSDGNAESLGFGHTICPSGHDYEGLFGCDLSLNGAYVVGAQVLKNLAASCARCSNADRRALRLVVLDNLNRMLPKGVLDPREARNRFQCEKAADGKLDLTSEQQQICDQLRGIPANIVNASLWDTRPEGKREEAER